MDYTKVDENYNGNYIEKKSSGNIAICGVHFNDSEQNEQLEKSLNISL